MQTFDFSVALTALRSGHRVAREGWNGKGMFLFLVPGSTFQVNREPLLSIMGEGTTVQYHAHIDMKTAQGYVVPWLASQADMLADDWVLVEPRAVDPIDGLIYEAVKEYLAIVEASPKMPAHDPIKIIVATVVTAAAKQGVGVQYGADLLDRCSTALRVCASERAALTMLKQEASA